MPCDNSEYDGSDFGSIQADSLEPRHRASSSGTLTDKDSSDVLLRRSYDKSKLARSLSNTISDFEFANKKIDCHSSEYCEDNSCHKQHLVTSDSSGSCKCLTRKNFLLTTHDNDEGQMSCNNHHQARQELSVPFYCQQGRNPISMNDLSVDLPKASVSPGVESKSYPSPFFGTNIPPELHDDMKRAFINEGLYMVTDVDAEFYGNPYTNKASSQAAHTHSLTMYNSMGSRLDHLQSRSKPYAHFDDCSSLVPPCLNSSWPSDVMIKSLPELSSYFSHSPLEKGSARNPPIYRGSTSSMPFDLSQGKHGGDTGSPHSSNLTTVAKSDSAGCREYSRESSRLSASSVAIGKNDSLGTSETAREITNSCSSLSPGFVIKMEDESLSPGLRSPHHLSSPYRSTSLSSWPVSSEFGCSNEDLGTTIKGKAKCASDSSLYLPTIVQAPPSPTSPSMIAKEEVVAVECRWKMCTQMFTSQRALAQHVNDCHVCIERPDVDFQCHWQGCPRQGKGFNARYKMLIHIRTHTNEKPHKCAVCRKCFSRLENLKIHMRSHTGEKPYACTFPGCTKAYSNSSDRFKHVRTHLEEKPYKCKMAGCHKQYTDPSSLRKHVRTHGHGTTAIQTPLQHSASRGNEFQISDVKLGGKDQNSAPFRRHSVDIHTDSNKGIKMDADRQMRQDLNNGRLDMRDIQQNIELYSSLEVKGGIQTFGQVEDCIDNEFQPTVLTNLSKNVQDMTSEEINLSTEDDVFDRIAPPCIHPPLLSVPSIIIEDAEDSSKSVDDLPSSGKKFDLSKIKRKRSDSLELDDNQKAVNLSSGEDGGEDLRKCFKDEDATDQSGCEKSKSMSPSSSPGDKGCPTNQATTTTASSSSSSHPKHWKKRKILDEENLQRKQQQQEEEEKRAEQWNEVLCEERSRAQSNKVLCEERSRSQSNKVLCEENSRSQWNEVLCEERSRSRAQLLLEVMTAHGVRPSPNLNLSAHLNLIQSFDSQSASIAASAKCCETLSSALSPPHTSLISSGGRHYLPPTSYYPSVCYSSLAPCTYSPAINPPHLPTFISPSLFTSYPELHPSHHNFSSSKFDHPLSAAARSAAFPPKAAKTCSNLYFPYLSALMDLSSGLDPLSQHHSHLSHMTLTSHPMAVDSPATMICPMVCPPASRTLP